MQTFLPYASFARSAAALDRIRLGNQRNETMQLTKALLVPGAGWSNHPAAAMWRGHEMALLDYQLAVCDEWTVVRGYRDTVAEKTIQIAAQALPQATTAYLSGLFVPRMPPWFGDEAFHRAHQSNLIRKNREFYAPQFPGVPDDLEYEWPST